MLQRTNLTFLLVLGIALGTFAQTSPDSDATRSIEAALRAQQYEQALQLARAETQRSSKNAKVWTLEGIALSSLGRDREAIAAYKRALAISPDFLAALEGAAQLQYKAGSREAVPLLDHILKLLPGDPTSHAMLAVLFYKKHDCATAVGHFGDSKEVISSQPVALAEYGSCLMDLQQPEDAIPVFQQILTLQPDDAHARYNLAVVQLTAHHGKDALDTLQPLLTANQPDADVLDLASAAYEETEDTPHAVGVLRQAIIASPKNARYYLDFAAICLTHESFQVGIDMVNAGLGQLPDSAALYVARGILYVQMAQYEKGEADFETANRLDPRETSASVAQGLAQMQESKLPQALATVQAQLKQHPKDSFLYYLVAQVITQNGAPAGSPQFKQAVEAASRAVQLKPDFVLARDVLGNLYLKAGQFDLAIEQSRRALQDNPSDETALYHLIQALQKSGKATAKSELPGLVKRLAAVRQESQKKEASANRYKLYEAAPGANSDAETPK